MPGYYQELLPYLDNVKEKMHFAEAVLTFVDDAHSPISPLPANCVDGSWSYTQFANFTNEGELLIRKDLWDSPQISEIDKAALLWHETIYHWLRVTKGDTSSTRARHIVGILFSTLAPADMQTKIAAVLGGSPPPPSSWICLLQSPSNLKVFSGASQVEREAQISAVQNCQQGGAESICTDFQTECDQITSDLPRFFCEITDFAASKTFSAHGRSQVEAKYNALSACLGSGSLYSNCNKNMVKCQ